MASEKANYESSYRITPLSSTGSARVDVAKGDPITDTPSSKEEPTPAENDEKQYPEGFKLVLLTMALMLAIFMIALDTNIVGTALPKITTQFASLNDVGWYGSAFLLAESTLQPTYGKLYQHFDIKRVYVAALVLFEAGSVISAAAASSATFIAGRAMLGAGSSGIFCGSLIITDHLVPLARRPLYIAIVVSMYGVASVAGPLLGGVFTDDAALTWRMCFWVNLPFGGLAILLVAIFFKAPRQKDRSLALREKLARMDFGGLVLLVCALTCLLLALQWGGIVYPWSSSRVYGCLIGFGILILLFIALQLWRNEDATIPPRIISQRTVATSCLFIIFINMIFNTDVYYLPFYFQSAQGTSARDSGIRMLPYLVPVALTGLLTGTLATLSGIYVPFTWLGAILLTIGSALLRTLNIHSRASQWVGYQLVTGIGFGAAFQLPYTAINVVLAPDDLPVGNAVTSFCQALGGAVAVSVAQNVFTNSLMKRLALVPGIDPRSVVAAGATKIPDAVPPSLLRPVQEAYSYALSKTLILPIAAGGLALLASLGLEWRRIEKSRPEGSDDA